MKITKPNITPGPWGLFDLSPAIKEGNAKPGADGTAFRISADRTLSIELRACGDGFVYGENKANAQAISCIPEMIDWLCEFYKERPSDPLQELLERIGCTIED